MFYKAEEIERKFAPLSFEEAVVQALNSFETQNEAADELTISVRTLYRWIKILKIEKKCKCEWELSAPHVITLTITKASTE